MDMKLSDEVLSPLAPEALEKFRVEKVVRPKTRGVCVCGHSMSHHYHSGADDTWSCSPGKTYCACGEGRAVIVADNLRLFMYMTTGVGRDHALGKGILACIESGSEFKWIDGHASCDLCHNETDLPIPVAVNIHNGADGATVAFPSNSSESKNAILCIDCFNQRWRS
jgi:hypothetical protein